MKRMNNKHANYSSSSESMDPRQIWYAPNRRLRRKSASARAMRIAKWVRTVRNQEAKPDEESLFIALHTCAYRAARRNGRKQIKDDERVAWARRWQAIRGYLIARNIGLAYSAVGRFNSQQIDQDDLLSDALYALTRAVDKFNPWKGFRFSTYAYNVITRSLMHRVRLENRYRELFYTRHNATPDVEENAPDFQAEVYIERLQRVLDRNLGNLSKLETHVLTQRFQNDHKPQPSLQKVGETVGLSKERVRQIQITAIRKLREALEQDPILQ